MGFFKDFKKFMMKGDIIALSTAVVMGTAFNSIVSSVVDNLLMPIIGIITAGADFSQQFIALDGGSYATLQEAQEQEAAVLTYGNVIQAIIYFVIVSFFIFLVLRAYERTKKKQEEAPAPPTPKGPTQEELLIEIRDELRKQNS